MGWPVPSFPEQNPPVAYGEHELEQRMHDWASGLKGKGIEEHLQARWDGRTRVCVLNARMCPRVLMICMLLSVVCTLPSGQCTSASASH
eukprot:1160142-Pelagomonas_calceolata.AAC.34